MADENNLTYQAIQCMLEIFSDDSDDSDDENFEESDDDMSWEYCSAYLDFCQRRERSPRLQNFVEEVVHAYTDKEFRSHFRMRRSTFDFILDTIKSSLIRKTAGCKMITPEKQLLIALWKMATPDSYRSICQKFDVSFSAAILSVRRVVNALVAIAPNMIVWPEDEKVNETLNGFAATSGFPNVIGAIDGTHINIPKPRQHSESYVNRKRHHSIQLQAVCDSQAKFIHCYAGNVGSVHDARVFRLSEVNDYLSDPLKFPNDCHLVGDAAYPIHRNLLTPYRDNGHLTVRQKNYNFCHSSARIAIERAFGLLKKRFRSLLTVLDMARTDLIPNFIIACCVLHNICLLKADELTVEGDIEEENENSNIIHNRGASTEGANKRDRICNQLPMRNV